VFDKRPPTEPPYAKHERYSKELEQQVAIQKANNEALKQEKDVLERLEQIQLAEESVNTKLNFLRCFHNILAI
jgi:hypothetical protein